MRRLRSETAKSQAIESISQIDRSRLVSEGWLAIEKSVFDGVDHYTSESAVEFSGGMIEVRQYRWSQPIAGICTTSKRSYVFELSLGGSKSGSQVTNLTSRPSQVRLTGRLIMIPPGQTISCVALPGHSRSIRCLMDAQVLESYLPEPPVWDGDLIGQAADLSGGEIEWLLRRMYREVSEPDFGTETMLETLVRQLALEVIRVFKLRDAEGCFRKGGLSSWHMRLIRNRLASEGPLPRLDELAQLCNLTVRHLARAFRGETGQTIGKHIEAAMVQRATAMLCAGTAVVQVAAALGYDSTSGFSSAFHRATGVMPSKVKQPRKPLASGASQLLQ